MIELKESSRWIYLVTLLVALGLHVGIFLGAGSLMRSPKPSMEKEVLPTMQVGLDVPPQVKDAEAMEGVSELAGDEAESVIESRPVPEVEDISEPIDIRDQAEVVEVAVEDISDWDWAQVDQPIAMNFGEMIELPPAKGKSSSSNSAKKPAFDKSGNSGKSGSANGGTASPNAGQGGSAKVAARYKRQPLTYPSESRQRGEEGTVLVRVSINEEGMPVEVSLHKSSGFPALDEAAINSVKSGWSFYPAKQGDVSVSSKSIVPVVFKLKK